jgi:hypothetical protein
MVLCGLSLAALADTVQPTTDTLTPPPAKIVIQTTPQPGANPPPPTVINATNVTIVLPAQPAAPAPVEVPLTTQRFENGSVHWADVSPAQIEDFLRDLNQRRDYDFSQHNEQPGPNHEFLTSWITQAVQQLISRGYTVDAIGDLHRPDQTVVATR